MKNNHKINRFKLFHIKKEKKNDTLSPKKQSDERIMRKNIENIAFRQYKQLKHQIFEQEKRDKSISKDELDNKYRLDFNYTNIMKILQKYISLLNNKSNDTPFNYDVKKGKLMLEYQNRNIRLNRINQYLKKIELKFQNVNSKLETGINNKKLFFSEEMAENIKNKIEANRKKIYTRNCNVNTNTNTNNNFNINYRLKFKTINNPSNNRNRNLNIINNNKKKHKIEISKYNENITNKTNSNNNWKSISFNLPSKKHIIFRKNKNKSLLCFNLINSKQEKSKNENNLKNELINNKKTTIDLYEKSKLNMETMTTKNKNLLSNSSNLTYYTSLSLKEKKGGKAKTIDPSERLIDGYNTNGLMEKYNKFYITKNYTNKNLSNRPQSCIVTKKQNKYISNETSLSNKNIARSLFSIKKKSNLKVINKPIYTSKIIDFINEYNRIKKNIKKLNINYKEKHFSTFKKIDHILEIKEDMQMFLLKQKFLHSKFKPKTILVENHKNEFINKMKQNIDKFEGIPIRYNYSNLEDLKIKVLTILTFGKYDEKIYVLKFCFETIFII